MKAPLEGHVVVVVGGTGGLGLSGALACIRAGANVVVVGRDAGRCREADEQLDDGGLALEGDATLPATAERAVQVAVERFGRFDAMYHVAGGSGRRHGDGPLDQITDDGWQFTLNLNLTSLMHSNRAAVRRFLATGSGGAVLNMTSVLADCPSPRHFATHGYAASKAAAVGLTKAAAAHYARDGIRFNAVAPALVDTPLAQRAKSDPEVMRYVAGKQPLDGGRIGTPADLDDAVVYLLSDQSKFVTGQVLRVDGGWSVSDGLLPHDHRRDSDDD